MFLSLKRSWHVIRRLNLTCHLEKKPKKIQLIDYECLVDPLGNRIIGFGRFAGIVGAYNGMMAYGKKYNLFDLKPAQLCFDKKEVFEESEKVRLSNIKIAVTGSGRVSEKSDCPTERLSPGPLRSGNGLCHTV